MYYTCSFVLDTKNISIGGKSINIECVWKLIDITLTIDQLNFTKTTIQISNKIIYVCVRIFPELFHSVYSLSLRLPSPSLFLFALSLSFSFFPSLFHTLSPSIAFSFALSYPLCPSSLFYLTHNTNGLVVCATIC